MSRKSRLAILGIVALAVIFILVYANVDIFSPAGGEVVETVEDVVTDEQETPGVDETEDGLIEEEFSPDDDPFALYEEARAEGRPIVIEYYARY